MRNSEEKEGQKEKQQTNPTPTKKKLSQQWLSKEAFQKNSEIYKSY